MRRGGMRWAVPDGSFRKPRPLAVRFAVGAAVLAVLVVAACQRGGPPAAAPTSAEPSSSITASPDASPTPPPADPLVTVEVCGLASAATATTTNTFNEQMADFELAAARNDQAAMVAASEAIDEQFVSLAQTATELAEEPIDPALRRILTDIATALEQMTALSYTGTTVDIRRKLLDFTLALNEVCAPLTATVTPSVG